MPVVNMHCHSFAPVLMSYVLSTERKVRPMASRQGNPRVENSGNVGSDIMVVEVLKQLVQENQALSAKVEAMEVQVNEMKEILLTLGNGGINANATTVNTEPQVICPSPLAESGISPLMCLPGINCQNHQAAQAPSPVIVPQKPPIGLIPSPATAPQIQTPDPKNLPQALHFSTQARKSYKTPKYPEYEQFDPVPMSYSELFDHLLSNHLITTRPMKPRQPPFPRNYNPNVTCKFHTSAVGHSIEDCSAFKKTVQGLIKSKWLSFDDSSASGLHARKKVKTSAMMDQGGSSQYDPLPMSYTDLCSFLIRHNLVSPLEMKHVQPPFPKGHDPKVTCEFHSGAVGHSVESCYHFKRLVQDLIDKKQLTFTEDGVCRIRSC